MTSKIFTRFALSAAVLAFGVYQPAQAKSRNFILDNDHTHIIWQVDRFGFTKTVGSFTQISGTVVLDETNPDQSSVEAIISLSGLRSDLQEREDIVRGEYWLDAANYPVITFNSTMVELIDAPDCHNTCAKVTGTLTLKGTIKPITMDVKLNKLGVDPVSKNDAAGFTAKGSFSRADFGLSIASGFIGDEVSFEIQALAIMSRATPSAENNK